MAGRSTGAQSPEQLLAAFAAELRALRDRMGAAAPSVDQVSMSENVPRSTLFAALSGSRLPSRAAVAALARSWGGDEAEWMSKRSLLERALPPRGRKGRSRQRNDVEGVDLGRITAPTHSPLDRSSHPQAFIPKQLPRVIPWFTGRESELQALTSLLDKTSDSPRIAIITGMAGVGKTTLAVNWAHQVADRFPDGQLYVDLRGFGPHNDPLPAEAALNALLTSVGVAPSGIPHGLDAAAGLYRTLLHDRRYLIVLDNVRDTDQVRPLLPGDSSSFVLLTSRSTLSPIQVQQGASLLRLDPFSPSEARKFLHQRLANARTNSDKASVEALVRATGGLPLALAVVSSWLATHPYVDLPGIANELNDSRRVLDLLESDEPRSSARAVLSWSYRNLDKDSADVFSTLGVHPGPEMSVSAVTSMTSKDASVVRKLINRLDAASLLDKVTDDTIRMHDIVRAYASEIAGSVALADDYNAVFDRMISHYIHTARSAARTVDEFWEDIDPLPVPVGVQPESFANREDAIRWFSRRFDVLVQVLASAKRAGRHAEACRLATTLETFLRRQGEWNVWRKIQENARESALKLDDGATKARFCLSMGYVDTLFGHYDAARENFEFSFSTYQELKSPEGQGYAKLGLAQVSFQQRNFETAIAYNQEALDLLEAGGRRAAGGRARVLLSLLYVHLGRHEEAVSLSRESLRISREAQDIFGEALSYFGLGSIYEYYGEQRNAVNSYKRSLSLYAASADLYSELLTSTALSKVLIASGAWRTATQLLRITLLARSALDL
jgi:tetratricopeptide (TPR) repeat protein